MAAVIRVKRLLEEDPAEALIINYKRRKVDENDAEAAPNELSTVWKFAGTIKTQEEDVLKHIATKKPTKEEAKEQFKKHIFNVNEKIREEIKSASKANRLKVVNCHRSNQVSAETSQAETSDDKKITIVDVESTELEKTAEVETKEAKYVYDLYYTNSDDFGEIDENEFISIHPLSDELVYGSRTDNGLLLSDTESEDSNAENNWRNDYPDESDMDSITEDDMIQAMNKVDLNKENELSSDDGEEGFVYSIDSEAAGFEEDVDLSDVRRYGEMYARFKARNKNVETTNLDSNFYYGDIDEEEYYY